MRRLFGLAPLSVQSDQAQVVLRSPDPGDFAAWVDARATSREFLQPWEMTWPEDALSRAHFFREVRRARRGRRQRSEFVFLVFRRSDEALIGGLTLSNVRGGGAMMASLGYWANQAFAGQGYMAEAVRLACRYAFHDLKLHRLEAACLPNNERSIRLLERTGFAREGYARAYLKIAGQWQDHLLYALVKGDETL